jgi:hypothetical protein
MPEFDGVFNPGSPAFSLLGTLGAGPKAIKAIVNKHFSDVPVEELPDGSLLFTSKKNGKEYAYRNGEIQGSDLKRTLYGMIETAPALAAGPGVAGAAAAGLIGSAITEGGKWLAGGGFNPNQLLLGTGIGAGVGLLSKAGRILINAPFVEAGAAGSGVGRATVDPALASQLEQAGLERSAAVSQAQTAAAEHSATQAQGARSSAAALTNLGGVEARAQAERDAAKAGVDAAKAALPPATTAGPNPAVHQLTAESEQLVQDLGGGRKPGDVNRNAVDAVGNKLGALQKSFRGKYAEVKKGVGSGKAYVKGFGEFIQEQAKEAGGYAKLPTWLKRAWRQIRPKILKDGTVKEAAYAMQDRVRKDLGDMAATRGPLANAGQQRGLAQLARDVMAADQGQSAENLGVGKIYQEAQKEAQEYFGLKKAAKAFLAKDVEDHLVGDVTAKAGPAIVKLAKGEPGPFNALMTAMSRPGLEELKPDVIRSVLSNKFGNIAAGEPFAFGKFNTWMKSLVNNPAEFASLMKNLDPEGRRLVQDLAKSSQGIAQAMAEGGIQEGVQSAEQVALKEAQDKASEVVKRTGAEMQQARRAYTQANRAATAASKETGAAAIELRQVAKDAGIKYGFAKKAFAEATKVAKEANKPGPIRKAIGYGSDLVSFIGSGLGFGGRGVHLANKAGAGDYIMTLPGFKSIEPAFRRLMAAADVPPSQFGQYLTKSLAANVAGGPVRGGRPELKE